MPAIRLFSAISKLKLYQYVLTGVGSPTLFMLESLNHLPAGIASVCLAVGLTGSITLTIFSLLAKNCVGIVYIDDENTKIKLAYVDFWGNRKNVEIEIENIMPLHTGFHAKYDLFQKFRIINSSSQTFTILHRFGDTPNPSKFCEIFG